MFKKASLCLCIFLSACCQNKFDIMTHYEIEDLKKIPQKPIVPENISNINPNIKLFKDNFYKPWHMKNVDPQIMPTNLNAGYDSSYTKYDQKWFDKHIDNMDLSKLNTICKCAITIKDTNLRGIPTNAPVFDDPKKAGEGFPFDNNQYSKLHIGTPIFVSHLSKDKKWVYVYTSEKNDGWINCYDIAYVENPNDYEKLPLSVVTKDNSKIIDTNGKFITYANLGAVLPKNKVPYAIDNKNDMELKRARIESSVDFPVKFKKHNVEKIINELNQKPYGWGGYPLNRDCSSMVRDYFYTFGIYLPRNSLAQIMQYENIDLPNNNKEEFIIKNAVPFLTILYCKKHIGLYVGMHNGRPVMFHEAWSVAHTKNGNLVGRNVIGKSVFTYLDFQRDTPYVNKDTLFINKMNKIAILK